MEPSAVKVFYEQSNLQGQYDIHDGEMESLAFLCKCSEDWKLCAADGAVFRVLGFSHRADQGISLEEILEKIGLSQSKLEEKYTKKFREKWTHRGKVDFIQGQGLL